MSNTVREKTPASPAREDPPGNAAPALKTALFCCAVRLAAPLLPWLMRRPLAWRLRERWFNGMAASRWLSLYGAEYDSRPPLPDPPAWQVLLDASGASPQTLARCLAALAAQRHCNGPLPVFLLNAPGNCREAVIAPPGLSLREFSSFSELQAALPPQGLLLRLTASCLPTPALCATLGRAFQEHPEADLAYSDEFHLDAQGKIRRVFCKPAWDPLYFAAAGYTGDCFAARASALRNLAEREQNGYSAPPLASREFFAALLSGGANAVMHLPVPLFGVAKSELPQGHEEKTHIPPAPPAASTIPATPPPRATIIIPFRDRLDLLRPCLATLLARTDYPNWNCVLVDNNSACPQTLAFLQNLHDPRLSHVRVDSPFNFSTLVNKGAAGADGDVFVLLNNDTEILSSGWLAALMAYAVQPEVGCVGGKLVFPNGLIQHGGIILGMDSLLAGYRGARHAHVGWPGHSSGYFGLLQSPRTVSAVSGALLAVRREVFSALGGFDENLAVTCNDLDFCLKAQDAGLRNVWTPEALLMHHDSASRGPDLSPEMKKHRQTEWAYLRARWGTRLDDDPWYNPNLSRAGMYCLAAPQAERGALVLPAGRDQRRAL